ncbi:MAG: TonB-dependent siderophore receptor [Scytonematopsis contorta HA4267-MV1]|jgi:iron complex outermembrane receptor protein|nr:TonB-dependent siderophore receptor [Scytonematopsis contorta HA4267-MV1]
MKVDKLIQNLLLTSVVVSFVTSPAKGEEAQKDVRGTFSTQTLGKFRLNDTSKLTIKRLVTNQSQVFVPDPKQPQAFQSLIPNSFMSAESTQASREIPQLSEVKHFYNSAEVLVQTPASNSAPLKEVIPISSVKANPTDKGVEVILQTTQGEQLQVANRSSGNSFIADITDAQLRLPNGGSFVFRSQKPIVGITEITVTNIDTNTIRVTVIGEAELPKVELFDDDSGLIFGVIPAATQPPQQPEASPNTEREKPTSEAKPEKPAAQQDETIELVVTGAQDGYRVQETTTGTRTDTPLRDIPQSIQVVPQQVLRDQQATRLEDALRNVTGVTQSFSTPGVVSNFTIRGFEVSERTGNSFLRDGLSDPTAGQVVELPNIEQVEVLKGPASVLFGFGNPGGTVNLVTKQPLREPFYAIDATFGSYSFYRGAIDLSGPLNDSKTILYRLNAAYRNSGSFIDFLNSDYLSVSPVVSVAISEKTSLALEGEYVDTRASYSSGVPIQGTILTNPNGKVPRNANFAEPTDEITQTISRIGYRLEHKFNDDWSLRNAFRATFRDYSDKMTIPTALDSDNRTFNRFYREYDLEYEDYSLTTNIVGKFATGAIQHQLLFGFDLGRFSIRTPKYIDFVSAPIDIFNPIYGQPLGDIITTDYRELVETDSLGIYLQDQIALLDNLKLLLGVRFDAFEQRYEFFTNDTRSNQSDSAFSPRFGIVYQPIPQISLYASYTSSFTPARGTVFFSNFDRSFKPGRGTQYEVGVKADLNNQLSATLAFYDLTRTNVLADDPNNLGFSIQTGEQKSQGIELNIAGTILPGWNIFAGYAYNDARITQDTTFQAGNRLENTAENSFNLWTTYQIQQGNLQGLGFGLGLFFVGERAGDLANTFDLPSYLRTDAAIFYNRDKFRAALNFKNLFDVDYFESSLSSSRVSYGQPFTLQGTISWQF